MTGKVRGMLLYQGAESYEDICVTKKMTRIGYGPDADIQIQADTISQLHARIDHDGEIYYIEDLILSSSLQHYLLHSSWNFFLKSAH